MNSENKKHAFYDNKRIELWKHLPLETPLSIGIDPSTFCNFKCVYCAHSMDEKKYCELYGKPEIMNWETFMLVVDQLKEFPQKIKKIHLECKGEPFCNSSLSRMVKVLKESNVAECIQIITNGYYLTKDLSDELIEAGLDILCISLQGMNSQKYKEICGVDINFENFVENIAYYYNKKNLGRLYIKNIDIALSDDDAEQFYKIFSPIADRVYIEKIAELFEDIDYSNIIKKKEHINKYGEARLESLICSMPFSFMCIFPNGEVRPCSNISAPIKLGNVYEKTLLEMWTGNKRKNFLIAHLKKVMRLTGKICSKCQRPNENMRPEDRLDEQAQYLLNKYSEI